MTKVIINGKQCEFLCESSKKITYDDIVIASGKTGNPTVTYRSYIGSGMLSKGQTVLLVSGMIFNVVDTGNA